MPASWCAARVAEARAWRDVNSQATPGWQHVHELLSQLDNPPAVKFPEADWLKEARRRAKGTPYTLPSNGASHDRRLLLAAYDAQQLELMRLRGQLRDAEFLLKDLSRA